MLLQLPFSVLSMLPLQDLRGVGHIWSSQVQAVHRRCHICHRPRDIQAMVPLLLLIPSLTHQAEGTSMHTLAQGLLHRARVQDRRTHPRHLLPRMVNLPCQLYQHPILQVKTMVVVMPLIIMVESISVLWVCPCRHPRLDKMSIR